MDFVVKLPSSMELMINVIFDLIMIAVDRLTKDIIFILFKEAATANELIYVFLRDVLAEHVLLDKLITDQDKLFILKFWQSLVKQLRIKHRLSTIYYP